MTTLETANRKAVPIFLVGLGIVVLLTAAALGGAFAMWTIKNVRFAANETYAIRALYSAEVAKLQAEVASLRTESQASIRQEIATSQTALRSEFDQRIADEAAATDQLRILAGSIDERLRASYAAVDRQLKETQQADRAAMERIDALTKRLDAVNLKPSGVDGITLGSEDIRRLDLFGTSFIRASDPILRNHYIGPGAGMTSGKAEGGDNLGIGTVAMSSISTGGANTAVGNFAMEKHESGYGNVAVGTNALQESVRAVDVTAVGWEASRDAISGVGTSSFGRRACQKEQIARNTTCVGDSALWLNQGEQNTGMGYRVAEHFRKGDHNLFLGSGAAVNRLSGNENTFVGAFAGSFNDVDVDRMTGDGAIAGGDRNVGLGFAAAFRSTGNDTVGVGHNALLSLQAGDGNVSVGSSSGASLTTGSMNTFIGTGAGEHRSQKVDVVNSTAIGAGTYTTADNQIVIGSDTTESIAIGGVEITPKMLRDVFGETSATLH